MKLASIPALALSLVLWSCDNLSEPTAALVGPEVGEASFSSSGGYKVVKENDVSVGTVTGVISNSGGKLVLGKHSLEVPRGAVSNPTTFTMTKLDGTSLAFEFSATRVLLNDVGAAGFAVPLKLTISYENASVADPSALRVVWLKKDGTQEVQTTALDLQGKRAIGDLTHFSQYALAFP